MISVLTGSTFSGLGDSKSTEWRIEPGESKPEGLLGFATAPDHPDPRSGKQNPRNPYSLKILQVSDIVTEA
jgi:hypothetical protein